MRTRLLRVLSLTIVAWLLVVAPAHAYVDPGTTGYVISMLVAAAAAAGMTLKLFWRRIVGFFRREDEGDDEVDAGRSPERVPDEV